MAATESAAGTPGPGPGTAMAGMPGPGITETLGPGPGPGMTGIPGITGIPGPDRLTGITIIEDVPSIGAGTPGPGPRRPPGPM